MRGERAFLNTGCPPLTVAVAFGDATFDAQVVLFNGTIVYCVVVVASYTIANKQAGLAREASQH